ncbi:hypothetical protein Dimus_011926 [Dionaea muscipula]
MAAQHGQEEDEGREFNDSIYSSRHSDPFIDIPPSELGKSFDAGEKSMGSDERVVVGNELMVLPDGIRGGQRLDCVAGDSALREEDSQVFKNFGLGPVGFVNLDKSNFCDLTSKIIGPAQKVDSIHLEVVLNINNGSDTTQKEVGPCEKHNIFSVGGGCVAGKDIVVSRNMGRGCLPPRIYNTTFPYSCASDSSWRHLVKPENEAAGTCATNISGGEARLVARSSLLGGLQSYSFVVPILRESLKDGSWQGCDRGGRLRWEEMDWFLWAPTILVLMIMFQLWPSFPLYLHYSIIVGYGRAVMTACGMILLFIGVDLLGLQSLSLTLISMAAELVGECILKL